MFVHYVKEVTTRGRQNPWTETYVGNTLFRVLTTTPIHIYKVGFEDDLWIDCPS